MLFRSEISMGLYTSDEIVEGDFKDNEVTYDIGEQVKQEILENENKIDFPPEDAVIESKGEKIRE